MCARARVRMVTDSGQREGVRGRRTGGQDSGTAGDRAGQERAVQGTAGGRRTGQRETVTDRETGREDTEHGDRDSRTGAGEDNDTGQQQNGRTKEDFHSHSHAVVVISPLKQRRPTTLAAGLLVVLVQEEGDLSHKWSPSLHSGTCSGLMRIYLTHFLSGFSGSGAVLFEKWL